VRPSTPAVPAGNRTGRIARRSLLPLTFWLAAAGWAPSLPGVAEDRFTRALQLFEQRGFLVRFDHPRCAAEGLYGFQVRNTATVVICPRGDRLGTLLHEGWHAVQSLCLRDRAWIPTEERERRLGRGDRRDIERLYPPGKQPREEEARLMAALPMERYFEELDRACGYSP
jgi:hypothetical protein